jgi:16S rRNA (uracil1498-N3)-methyltransferase
MHRFYIPPENWNPDNLVLSGTETHHCTEVLRLSPGKRIVVFDGRGAEATAEIVHAGKREVTLRTVLTGRSPKLPCHLTLAQAVPKGKTMDLIVQKAVELGAAAIVPLLSERVVRQLEGSDAEKKSDKWQTIAIEAAKQCGQNWLPQIAPPVTPRDFFTSAPSAELPLIASLQPGARPFREVLRDFRDEHGRPPASALILIGPEGDFTPAETGLALAQGCRPVSLGPIVLRTETAALYSLSVLAYELF